MTHYSLRDRHSQVKQLSIPLAAQLEHILNINKCISFQLTWQLLPATVRVIVRCALAVAKLLLISSHLSEERYMDVVFVHGLGGDPIYTWRRGMDQETSWPHWLSVDFGEKIGVWSLGYAAAPTKFRRLKASIWGSKDPDRGAAMSLTRRTENALDRLVCAGIGQRLVCFITHSLGGLLVKSILRKAADSSFAPERLRVVEQCRGVIFLATPHHGSELASLASAFKLYFPTVSTLDLKYNDDHLIDLYEWYRSYAPSHHIFTRTYYENKQVGGVAIVVSRSSADPGITGEFARGPTPLDSDHLEISKPRDRQDQAFIGSTQLINHILSKAYSAEIVDMHPKSICPNNVPFTGASEMLAGDIRINETGQKATGTVLEIVIDERRTLDQALEIVRMINLQRDPERQARLLYIEEGSTHLFLDGDQDALQEILTHCESKAFKRLLIASDHQDKELASQHVAANTINYAGICHSKQVLEKANLIRLIIYSGAWGSDLTLVNLSGANLENVNLREVKLFRGNLVEANLSGADLFRGNLVAASLSRANLSGADLSEANLGGANLNGANLSGANLGAAYLALANLRGADLRGANLIGAEPSSANLKEACLRDADLLRANLNRSNLISADLCGANLRESILSGADLYRADLSGAHLDCASLRHATLREANLKGSFFRNADLRSTILSEANLSGADLSRANFKESDISRANLSGANLSEAILIGADLTLANLAQANLSLCRFGNNEGLSEDQKDDMKIRGALFEDSPESGVPSLAR
jgi:uncharacterized protein YjbI with pentapeptide repeats